MPLDDVKILRQTDGTQFIPGGGSRRVLITTFSVGDDGPYTVEVPADGYQAAATLKAIEDRADQIRLVRTSIKPKA